MGILHIMRENGIKEGHRPVSGADEVWGVGGRGGGEGAVFKWGRGFGGKCDERMRFWEL